MKSKISVFLTKNGAAIMTLYFLKKSLIFDSIFEKSTKNLLYTCDQMSKKVLTNFQNPFYYPFTLG